MSPLIVMKIVALFIMGVFMDIFTGSNSANECFTVKKPKLYENRTKFNANPQKFQPPNFFLAMLLRFIAASF